MPKKKSFNVVAVVREIARERIGSPKPTAVIRDKRYTKRDRDFRREMREEKY